MKQLLILISFCVAISCITTNRITKANSGILNGTWKPTKEELGGTAIPASTFENQRLTISDSTYTLLAENTDKGVIRYSDGKMDIYGKEGVNAGTHITAIYKYETGLLTICYNLLGTGYPPDFETKDHPTYFLVVFEKKT